MPEPVVSPTATSTCTRPRITFGAMRSRPLAPPTAPVHVWPTRVWPALVALVIVVALVAARARAQETAIPAHNRADLTEAPPRPPLGDAAERASRLFDAIVRDDPTLAEDFFLPQDAFRLIKAMSDPDTLWTRIHAAYEEDIHELHASIEGVERATFVRLDLSRRRSWVVLREESNRLPYWAQRHNTLVYAVDGTEHTLEVRTMIAWDDRWYITHLSEFRH